MPGNAKIEPEAMEMSYTSVSSTTDYTVDYTVEQTVVEPETSADKASYGVHYFVFLLN